MKTHRPAIYQEWMKVKPDCVVVYKKIINRRSRLPPRQNRPKEDNKKISKQAKTKITDRVKIWSQCVKNAHRRHVFVTLTLTSKQIHKDAFMKRYLLNSFLIQMKAEGASEYLWKAERQKNGNIHFHIITDSYLSKERIRLIWLRSLKKHGYRADMVNQQRYPCSDVKGVKDEKKLSRYLTKYITKETEGEGIEGRLWYMTRKLSQLKYPEVQIHENMLIKGDSYLVITEEVEIRRLLHAVGYYINWSGYYCACARMVYNV